MKTKYLNICRLNGQQEQEKKEQNKVDGVTEYGYALFDYFCKDTARKQVAIRSFKKLPKTLHDALFVRENKIIITNNNIISVFGEIIFK